MGTYKLHQINHPSIVASKDRMERIFKFIDNLLQRTGKIGEYDQKI